MNNPNFVDQVSKVTFDMTQDEGAATSANRPSQLKWDRKKKKMVAGDGVGADNKKMIRSESGALLPASYKSGRFDEWRKSKRVSQPSRKPQADESAAKPSDKIVSAVPKSRFRGLMSTVSTQGSTRER